jgi:hypothetical protein
MPDIQHVVLTRFNLPIKDFATDRSGQTTLTKEWLEHRIRLFRDVCVPSMAAQTCRHFRWFLLIDAAGAEPLRQRLEAMLDGIDAVILEAVKPWTWRKGFRQALMPLPQRLLVTRLDNDDALHPDYVRRAQEVLLPYAKEPPNFLTLPLVLNFHRGMCWDGEQFLHMAYPQNAFATWLVDRSETDPAGFAPLPLDVSHVKVAERFSLIDLYQPEPMWVQFIHQRNVSNNAWGKPAEKWPEALEQAFGYLRNVPL